MAINPDCDDSVRQALDPDAGTVDRMVSRALERGRVVERRQRMTWRLALAATAMAGVLLTLWLWREPSSVAPSADDLVLTRAGEVVMIQSASGETMIFGPGASADLDRRPGTGFVLAEGDTK
jgi:hypothetical protein